MAPEKMQFWKGTICQPSIFGRVNLKHGEHEWPFPGNIRNPSSVLMIRVAQYPKSIQPLGSGLVKAILRQNGHQDLYKWPSSFRAVCRRNHSESHWCLFLWTPQGLIDRIRKPYILLHMERMLFRILVLFHVNSKTYTMHVVHHGRVDV